MSSVNKAIIVGHLGADPELRHTQSGSPVCNLRVATSENWTDKQTGEKNERTEWHRVSVFGRQAELCSEYLSKGRLVYIEGRIQTRKWEDKEGNDRYTTEIVAQSVQFLGSRDGNSGGGRSYDSSYDQSRPSSGSGKKQQGGGNDFNQSFDDDDIPF